MLAALMLSGALLMAQGSGRPTTPSGTCAICGWRAVPRRALRRQRQAAVAPSESKRCRGAQPGHGLDRATKKISDCAKAMLKQKCGEPAPAECSGVSGAVIQGAPRLPQPFDPPENSRDIPRHRGLSVVGPGREEHRLYDGASRWRAAMTSKEIIEITEKFGAHNYHPLPIVITERGRLGQGPRRQEVHGLLSAYSAINHGHRPPRGDRRAQGAGRQGRGDLARLPTTTNSAPSPRS